MSGVSKNTSDEVIPQPDERKPSPDERTAGRARSAAFGTTCLQAVATGAGAWKRMRQTEVQVIDSVLTRKRVLTRRFAFVLIASRVVRCL